MQAAIDGNGSSNTTTITTIISSTEIKNEDIPNSSRTQHHQNTQKYHQQYHQPHSLLQSTLPDTEATNLLKHNVNTNNNTCTNFNAVPATENDLWHFLNAAECLFVTPSTTPQASPSKSSNFEEEFLTVRVAGNGGMQSITISTPFQDAYNTNTSSETASYKTESNSTSTTTSVIATTMIKLDGESKYKSIEKNDGATEDCEQLKDVAAELLQWQDMPQYLQFNPYVLKGYRPLTTFKGCLLSLFYWHNETINILTHAIPIVYILAIVPGLMPWENGYGFLSFCHIFGSVAPWCGSFVYHLFMNIERGENVYNRLLKLDMVGIWVSQSFGALPLLTASTFCFSFLWKWLIIISYCLLSFWGLYKALTASSPWQRRLCFGLPFVMRSILTFFRTIGLVGGNRVALEHVYLQDGVSIIGGAIGAMRIPEKWFPGLVDFYLNSHNIMHVLVVVAVYSMFKATMKDLEWMESANCDEFENITSKVLESTLSAKIDL